MRQEELKQRKNKIIQLLNGEVSEDEEEEGSNMYEDDDQNANFEEEVFKNQEMLDPH